MQTMLSKRIHAQTSKYHKLENQMNIEPKEGFILLEAYEIPQEIPSMPNKIIMPNMPKYTQIYRVVSKGNVFDLNIDDLVYIKGFPTQITQKDKTYYMTEEANIIARVQV